ncbi:CHAT domain-containing protein [Micromonospora rubida]
MRDQWLSRVRSRFADDAGPYALLEDAALVEVVELVASTTQISDIAETCHVVGWLHWYRAAAFADNQARSEIHTAIPLFMLVRASGAPFSLPKAPAGAFPELPDLTVLGELWEQAFVLLEPWMAAGADPHFLELVVRLARNAVAGARPGHPQRVSRLSFLNAAAQRLFEQNGNVAALDEAIAAGRSAMSEAAGDDPNLAGYLTHLADSLRVLFERDGDVAVLREAVAIGRQAVRALGDDHDRRYLPLTSLGTALLLLYRRVGAVALLDEAVEACRAAAAAAPEGIAASAVLANYSAVLQDRIERTGDQSTLNEALAVTRRAVSAAPDGSPMRLSCLYNLANLLQAQFERSGDVRALDEAIEVMRFVVDATPPEHPDAPLHGGLLGRQLRVRFELTGYSGALDEAIFYGHQGVAATPADHVNRLPYLNNLAVALKTRAQQTGDLDDLRQVIELNRLAARTAVGVGAYEALTLSNLTSALGQYAEYTGDSALLEEAIAIGRAAVGAAAEDHSRRAVCEINLARVLAAHNSLDEAIGLLAAAALRPTAQPSIRVEAAQGWGRLGMRNRQVERALQGYTVAVELLPQLATRGLSRADASRWLVEYSELASDAAACALEAGRPDRAIELLEHGRGVLLAQALEARSDLTELREVDAELADRFEFLCGCLDSVADDETPDRRREQAVELEALLARIRSLPGQELFLLPPDAAALTAQAHDGPIVLVNVSRYRSDAIIVTTGGVLVRELPDLDPGSVAGQQTAMRDALNVRHGPTAAELTMLETLAWLWDKVAGPVLERLSMLGAEPWPRIWWIPCGPLAALPLHAAGHHLDESGPGRRTVLDRAVSSYTPTVRTLAHSRARTMPVRSNPPRMLAVVMPGTPQAPDLPGARQEFRQLSRLFPAIEGLVGPAATRDAVLSRLPSSPWVHFACHATTDPDDPSNNQLLVHDHASHPLRVVDMSSLNMAGTEFAYLSACSTAVTAAKLANESIHVVSACQLAGYPHVVGTLWEIDDSFATTVAERVYEDLAAGGFDAAQAGTCLHRAVRLTRDRYPRNPILWAAYIHAGP